MNATKNDIPLATRLAVAQILNETLADLIDLQLQAKQAHWNVRGPNFLSLHELFDRVAEKVEESVDMVAERIGALGQHAEGTILMVIQRTRLATYPLEIVSERDHIESLATSLATVAAATRAAINRTALLADADSTDLVTEVSREIDQQLWFVESHLGNG